MYSGAGKRERQADIMKKYMKLIAGIAVLIVLLGGGTQLYQRLSQKYEAGQGLAAPSEEEKAEIISAPDFTVLNREGEEVSLSSLTGKPIILNFWASWCSPCKREFPDFQAAYEKYGSSIEFVMVNLTDGIRETREKADDFIEEMGYTMPVYYDTMQDAAGIYAVYSIPTTYFIDMEGNIVAGAEGMLSARNLEKGIAMIQQEEQ